MRRGQLETYFNPKSIALIGASDSGRSVGSKVFANLIEGKFQGSIIPINPKYKILNGNPCYASIKAIEESIDLAIIATPAQLIPKYIEQCGKAGIHSAIILSEDFGNTNLKTEKLEEKVLKIAKRYGVKFIGPNCAGIVRPWNSMNASYLQSKTPKGRLALVSQSGELCSAITDWAEPHNFGFSAILSMGNSADVGFGNALKFLAYDNKTDAILLYLESIRHPRVFLSGLRIAAKQKPVIVLKGGRHHQSSKTAITHTGTMIGEDSVFEAALERAGAVKVDTFGQLFAAAEILSATTRTKGNRLGIVTNGGCAGVLAADRVGDLNLQIPSVSQRTIQALDKIFSQNWSKSNPIDIMGHTQPENYGHAIKASLEDPNFDAILAMFTPQTMTDSLAVAQSLIEASKETRKPILACWMGQASVEEARKLLMAHNIPSFLSPERAVEAFSYLAKHERNRKLNLEMPGPLSDLESPDIDEARLMINQAIKEGRSILSNLEAKAVLSAFHIPTNPTQEAATPEQALSAANTIGYPVTLKINSPDIIHKSDVGGVRNNIMSAHDIETIWHEIIDNIKTNQPDAKILGLTVEKMVNKEHARELVVGASKDPVFGPSILFGAGGTMVEVLSDNAVSLPPLNTVLAKRLINRTRVSRLLDAFRNRPAVDRNQITNVLLRISDLICEFPEIEELDINPLFAGPEGIFAVDPLIRINRPPKTIQPYDHVAIFPYPRHLVEESILENGTKLTIRPIRPEDAESERAFVRRLSPETRQFRFMYLLKELTPEMLVRFTQIDYSNEMAFLAITEEDGEHVQQGVARYAINADEVSCEFAIVVSDEHQHQGIGKKLMLALINAARQHGLKTIEGSVLVENYKMLGLMKDLGFTQSRSMEDNTIVNVEFTL